MVRMGCGLYEGMIDRIGQCGIWMQIKKANGMGNAVRDVRRDVCCDGERDDKGDDRLDNGQL